MYCVKCGTKAEKGQKLCHECGMRLISPEALLKLLKKADAERKLSSMDVPGRKKTEKDESFVKGYMDRLHQDDEVIEKKQKKKKTGAKKEEKKTEPVKAVREKPISEKDAKRVTPLFENPTQPKKVSIFEDAPKPVKGKKEKPTEGRKPQTAAKKHKTGASNPVVRLPGRSREMPERRKRDQAAPLTHAQLFNIPERDYSKRKPPAGKSAGGPAAVQRPDKAKRTQQGRPASPKSAKPAPKRPSSGGSGAKKARPRREEENFAEKYLRSIISMMLLTCTVILMLMWGYATDSGLRTMAELGLGSQKGYILLGDDCMAGGNYRRAVEHYYKALNKKVSYEAGIKLAGAYRQTGETEKETSALLLLMDRYESADEPYERILQLYPDPDTRPEKVQNAINMHER